MNGENGLEQLDIRKKVVPAVLAGTLIFCLGASLAAGVVGIRASSKTFGPGMRGSSCSSGTLLIDLGSGRTASVNELPNPVTGEPSPAVAISGIPLNPIPGVLLAESANSRQSSITQHIQINAFGQTFFVPVRTLEYGAQLSECANP